ncbi:MAG: DUF1045 domain-containing protein [Rhodobacteraceae bacterium]|nr:DUF1045 domain-containing protein [Paracoccaceae bacterium]
MTPTRYAIYYVPAEAEAGAKWARFATDWLGWDCVAGAEATHPGVDGLPVDEITETPRKYGLHATIKPPFRLAAGQTADALGDACAALAGRCAPVALDALRVARLGRFLALRPEGRETALNALAAQWVETLDPFRAPPTESELVRRRAAGLTAAQEENLQRWGYPYVMDGFRFHITLTGRLPSPLISQTEAALDRHLAPMLPRPFHIGRLALAGEAEDGRFHLLHSYTLAG